MTCRRVAYSAWPDSVSADGKIRGGPHLRLVVEICQPDKIFSGLINREARVSRRVIRRNRVVRVLHVLAVRIVLGDHKRDARAGRNGWKRIDDVDVAQRPFRTESFDGINAGRGFDYANAVLLLGDLQVFASFEFVLSARSRDDNERNSRGQSQRKETSGEHERKLLSGCGEY